MNNTTKTPSRKSTTGIKMVSTSVGNGKQLELCHENYTAYIFAQLFDAFYLPWIKESSGPARQADFTSRLEHLNDSLESAFPKYGLFKRRIMQMAKRNAFSLVRRLKVTVEEVRQRSNNAKVRLTSKVLRVRLSTVNTADGQVAIWLTNFPVQVQANFTMYLDFPINLNDSKVKVSIEFLFSDWDPQTGAPQLEEEELRSMEAILRVAESDISGFTGHNGKCCLLDETTSEMVDIKLNLSWDLKVESIQEQLQWGNIVAAHFSSGLLATGAYYWKFYGSLFGALLLDPSTETEALKCLNEIAFILGSSHKQGLAKHLMVLLQKRILAFEANPVGCCADECDNQARLFHGVLLVLESLPVDDQGEMMLKLGDPTFAHLLRLRCLAVSSSRLVHLHQVALRKLMLIAKKNKSRSGRQVEPLLGYLSKLLIDTVKQGDQTFTSKEEAAQLQDDAIWILAKLSKATKEDGDRTVTGSCTTSTESSGDEESSYSDEDSVEEDVEEAQESEYSTSESLDTQLSSPKTTTTSTPSLAAFNVALGNFQAKRGPHWEHFAKVPPTVVERLLGEDTLEDGVYYEQMKTLLKKVARQIKEADSE